MSDYRFHKWMNPTNKAYASFICPKCGREMGLARFQYEGNVSIVCPFKADCKFHETINFRKYE